MKRFKSIEDVLVFLFNTEGLEILNDPARINGFISDCFPKSFKERSAIKVCLDKGFSRRLYTAITQDNLLSQLEINQLKKLCTTELWMADEAIDYVMSVFIDALKNSQLSSQYEISSTKKKGGTAKPKPSKPKKPKNQKTHKKPVNTKKIALVAIVVSVLVVFLGLFALIISVYFQTHTKMPISLNDSIGDDYLDVVDELEDAGFGNITTKEDDSGILAGGKVTGITIDGKDVLIKDWFYSKDADIVVFYSSDDRINLERALKDMESMNYQVLTTQLSSLGFKVDCNEIENDSTSKNDHVSYLIINGTEYNSGDCFVPANAEITVFYYGTVCKLKNDADDFIGDNYKEVRAELIDLGFDNIVIVKMDDLITGWVTKDGSIESVTIDGDADFKDGDKYYHDVEVVITIHTFPNEQYAYVDD